ncbi:hypothetical protein HPB50_006522 [Hyalomma asiaticum]|uniref:Uncharacterized protein n=1 Tax=Hyalomma asiaticum TaxID=266040 RepID=A0ACB7RVP8_HYAAI|nr:hypothetical protein HPB50_006522 [Hyalomma asiaticum]
MPSGENPVSIPTLLRRRFFINPLPQSMVAGHHGGQWRARALPELDAYASRPGAAYVEAGRCPSQRILRVTGSVRLLRPAEAEQAAIALAVSAGFSIILSDWKTAISHFARGTVAPGTLRLRR